MALFSSNAHLNVERTFPNDLVNDRRKKKFSQKLFIHFVSLNGTPAFLELFTKNSDRCCQTTKKRSYL